MFVLKLSGIQKTSKHKNYPGFFDDFQHYDKQIFSLHFCFGNRFINEIIIVCIIRVCQLILEAFLQILMYLLYSNQLGKIDRLIERQVDRQNQIFFGVLF